MNGREQFIPIVAEDAYKVILRPATTYDTTRRTLAFPEKGVSYVYGVTAGGVSGEKTEIIEVWFARKGWTASRVIDWMQKHGEALPTPSRQRKPSGGRPALAGDGTR